MKIADVWKSNEFYTEHLTEHGRQLGFGIAAICWFFKTPEITFPTSILLSLIFVVGFLFLDVLQYFAASLLTGGWARHAEKKMWAEKNTIDEDIEKPAWLDRPVKALFILKNMFLFASGWFLVSEFIKRL